MRRTMHRARLTCAVALALLLIATRTAGAATLVVTNTLDDGGGSLRDAIAQAASGDTITFAIPASDPGCTAGACTITLASELTIDKSLAIQGPGASALTLSGNDSVRVFMVRSLEAISVTIARLTIAHGRAFTLDSSLYGSGGGIHHETTGVLTVTECEISANRADEGGGGGVHNESGTVHVVRSLIRHNVAIPSDSLHSASGGGIFNYTGTMTIDDSVIADNESKNAGDGIHNFAGTMTIRGSTLSGHGDAVFHEQDGSLTIGRSTFTQNGTAIVAFAPARIVDATIVGNGRGVWTALGFVSFQNSIVAMSGPDVEGEVTSLGHNLIGNADASGAWNPGEGDRLGSGAAPLDPGVELDAAGTPFLKNNGGPTPTIALLPGSPALDAAAATVDPSTGQPVTTDQRGSARPIDLTAVANAAGSSGADIGAFELVGATSCGLTMSPVTLPAPALGVPYIRRVSPSGSGWNLQVVEGSLPPGLQAGSAFGLTGIAGVPTTPGTYTFTVEATKSGSACRVRRTYTVTVAPTVLPLLTCVKKSSANSYTATFGYDNSTASAVTLPVGSANYFTPGAANRGQTTVFQVGKVTNAFNVTFKSNGKDLAVWLVRGPDGVLRPVNITTATSSCQ